MPGTDTAAQGNSEPPQFVVALSKEVSRTERLRVVLAVVMFPLLAGVTIGLVWVGVGVAEWLTLVVAPVMTLVLSYVLTGRITAVAAAAGVGVAANATAIDANRLHASERSAMVELRSEPRTIHNPLPNQGANPAAPDVGGQAVD